LRPLPSKLRPARVSLKAWCRRSRPKMTWIVWLMLAVVLAAALSPGQINASRLVFQSSPPSLPPPQPPPPTQPPPPPPTATPVPPTDTPVPVAPTQLPTSAPEPAPTEALPTPTQPAQPPPVTEQAPAQPVPTPEPVQVPTTASEAAPPAPTSTPPDIRPRPPVRQSPADAPGQPVINWVKFWDTMAVVVAYPWLCCGVSLLLLVPLVLLFLEIKGRRPPSMPPEPMPGEKRRRTRRMRDEQ
jgi:hypothetical protein